MGSEMDGLFFIFVFSSVLAFGSVLMAAMLWSYIFSQRNQRSRIRDRTLAAHSELVSGQQWFPVRYASQRRFDTFLKLFPWEAAGILVTLPGSVMFIGESMLGAPLKLEFDPEASAPGWLGKPFWPNGAASFFFVNHGNERHYFSSETGAFVFGSNRSTRAIYKATKVALARARRRAG